MDISTLLSPSTLLFSCLLISWTAIAIGIYCLLSTRKQIAHSRQVCEKLTRDLQVVCNGAAGMGQRIIALEKKLSATNEASVGSSPLPNLVMDNVKFKGAEVNVTNVNSHKLKSANSELKNTRTDHSNLPAQEQTSSQSTKKSLSVFDQAKQLLRNGISERQVIKTCGLSTDEVALIKVLIQNDIDTKQNKTYQANVFQPQTSKMNVFA